MNISLKQVGTAWQVRIWQGGKYVRRQFKTREAAEQYQMQLAQTVSTVPAESLSRADMSAAVTAQLRANAGGYTLARACDLIEVEMRSNIKRVEIGATASEFETFKVGRNLRAASITNIRSRLGQFVQHAGPKTIIADISQSDISEYMDLPGPSPRSQINNMLILRNFFQWCVKRLYCKTNPTEGWERPKCNESDPYFVTAKEAEEVLRKAEKTIPRMRVYLALAMFAGMRRGEIKRLEWSDINMDQDLITVNAIKAKTRSRRHITIQPNLKRWLELGGEIIPPAVQLFWSRIRPVGYKPDGMRRAFCSHHLVQFGSAGKTAAEAGHWEAVLYRHYRGLVSKEEAQHYWSISPTPKTLRD